MRYEYTKLPHQPAPCPYLEIYLRNGYATSDKIFGLVDSGADYCIFPLEVATRLKIDFPDPKLTWNFQGTTGRFQIAYRANVELTVVGDRPSPDFQFVTEVGFCPDFNFPGGGLLGQYGFFSKFKSVKFSQIGNYFELDELTQLEMTLSK